MLVLLETAAGYAVFKVLKESKLKDVDNIWKGFETPEEANKMVQLLTFNKFKDATEALAANASAIENKMNKKLKKMLKKLSIDEAHEELAVADTKVGGLIKEKLGINCVHSDAIDNLLRGIRGQMSNLIGIPQRELSAMTLGLAHGLSRYKLKFSPEKIDTMIVQAVSLLDDLDKELNNYIMRCKEWYGWHFPELGKLITDHVAYAKTVVLMGTREKAVGKDFSDILPEEVESEVKKFAEISMGTEISKEDVKNIKHLCNQIIELSDYRNQLAEYLKNRMTAIAPNVTMLVGEILGARLISHAGSLVQLAKQPASTVQVFGAEKALFRAIKNRDTTPKYGLLYHATLVTKASPKFRGKIARMLAAKTALAIRVDALREETEGNIGMDLRVAVEQRLTQLEEGKLNRISGMGKYATTTFPKQVNGAPQDVQKYDTRQDSTLPYTKKRKFDALSTPKAKSDVKKEADDIEERPSPKKKKQK